MRKIPRLLRRSSAINMERQVNGTNFYGPFCLTSKTKSDLNDWCGQNVTTFPQLKWKLEGTQKKS